MAKPRRKRPKTYRSRRFGILNHLDEVWTSETFRTPIEAQEYLDKARPIYGDLPEHKIAPVRVAISVAAR